MRQVVRAFDLRRRELRRVEEAGVAMGAHQIVLRADIHEGLRRGRAADGAGFGRRRHFAVRAR